MDLNKLYFDHQLLLMRLGEVLPAISCKHDAAARHLAQRIGKFQRSLGAPGAAGWEVLASTPRVRPA